MKQGKGKKAKHNFFTDRTEVEEFIAEHKKAKEKNKDTEEQTNNREKPKEKEYYSL